MVRSVSSAMSLAAPPIHRDMASRPAPCAEGGRLAIAQGGRLAMFLSVTRRSTVFAILVLFTAALYFLDWFGESTTVGFFFGQSSAAIDLM